MSAVGACERGASPSGTLDAPRIVSALTNFLFAPGSARTTWHCAHLMQCPRLSKKITESESFRRFFKTLRGESFKISRSRQDRRGRAKTINVNFSGLCNRTKAEISVTKWVEGRSTAWR
jgi:hypothetical protein